MRIPRYPRISAEPFLKWVGGKRQLVDELLKYFPARVDSYVEPFVGGGALFFAMRSRGMIRRAWLSDANDELVTTYYVVRDRVEELIARLHRCVNTPEFFAGMRAVPPSTLDPVRRAARFIYLNKTCFNGLYRVNLKGQFNAPYGKYENPRIFDVDGLRAASRALQGVSIVSSDFLVAVPFLTDVHPRREEWRGTAFYCDPPYWPASQTSDFTSYTAGGFGADDQRRLRDAALDWRRGGAHVVLSNSDVEPVRALYRDGFELHEVRARRNVNSRGDKRGSVGELIIVAR